MKKILFLLVLLSSVYAADGACHFQPDADPEAAEAFASAMSLVGVAIGLSIVVVSISYMLGKAMANPRLILFSKDELAHLGITVLLTIFIISIFEGSCLFFTNFLEDSSGPLGDAQDYMYSLRLEGQHLMETLLKGAVEDKFEAARVYGYMAPFIGGETGYNSSYYNAFARQKEILADMVSVGYVNAGVQYFILLVIEQ